MYMSMNTYVWAIQTSILIKSEAEVKARWGDDDQCNIMSNTKISKGKLLLM